MARRKYTREFKISAVKLVNEQGYSPVEAAKSLGVDASNVRYWLEKFSAEVQSVASRDKLTELLGGRAQHEHLTPL